MSIFPTCTDLLDAFRACRNLRQSELDNFIASGVSVSALANDPGCYGMAVCASKIVFHGTRFDFADDDSDAAGAGAFIVANLDEDYRLVDLVAFRPRDNQAASWLGRLPVLGACNINAPRLGKPLQVHATVLDWLRAGRSGVYIIERQGAAPLLRNVEPIAVSSWSQAQELHAAMITPAPRILIAEEALA